jgi:hypothetical protein
VGKRVLRAAARLLGSQTRISSPRATAPLSAAVSDPSIPDLHVGRADTNDDSDLSHLTLLTPRIRVA